MTPAPYITSNWVEGTDFYGRHTLCQTLTSATARCIYLVGIRRIGKTSLLKRLVSLMPPYAVYCDLMHAASQDGDQPVLDESRIVRLLQRELKRRESDALVQTRDTWDRQETSLVSWLEEVSWVWEDQGITLTLLWDEAEMLKRLPAPTLMRLRALLQHSNSLRLIVSASKGLAAINEQWRDEDVSPFLFGFKIFYLAGLTDDEADELINQRGTVKVHPDQAATIRTLTGNHPFLLQSLCDKLYHNGALRKPEERDIVIDYMMADMFRIDVAHLSPTEQALLSTLAEHGPSTLQVVLQHTDISEEVIHTLAHGMLNQGYVRLHDAERWSVGNEYLARWVRSAPLLTPSSVTDQATLEVVDEQLQYEAEATSDALDNNSAAQLPDADDMVPLELDEPLSDRERQVLRLLAQGLRNPEIASQLTVSDNTVKAHVKNIYRKMGVHDRVQAVNRGRELGML